MVSAGTWKGGALVKASVIIARGERICTVISWEPSQWRVVTVLPLANLEGYARRASGGEEVALLQSPQPRMQERLGPQTCMLSSAAIEHHECNNCGKPRNGGGGGGGSVTWLPKNMSSLR